jgi:hypothetical protein
VPQPTTLRRAPPSPNNQFSKNEKVITLQETELNSQYQEQCALHSGVESFTNVQHTTEETQLLNNGLTKSRKSTPWESNSCSGTHGIPSIFLEPEGSLPYSQEPATDIYSEPDEFSSHPHPISPIYILILSSYLCLRLLCLPSDPSYQNPV